MPEARYGRQTPTRSLILPYSDTRGDEAVSLADLETLDEGMVVDMLTEFANDTAHYTPLATQEDIDRL